VKIKGEANPYDPAWEEYFEKRLGVKMVHNLKGKRQLLALWKEQKGLCPICQQKITKLTGWHNCLRYEPGYPSHLEKLAKHRTHQTANCYDPAENSCKNVNVLLTLATRTVSCRGDDIES